MDNVIRVNGGMEGMNGGRLAARDREGALTPALSQPQRERERRPDALRCRARIPAPPVDVPCDASRDTGGLRNGGAQRTATAAGWKPAPLGLGWKPAPLGLGWKPAPLGWCRKPALLRLRDGSRKDA